MIQYFILDYFLILKKKNINYLEIFSSIKHTVLRTPTSIWSTFLSIKHTVLTYYRSGSWIGLNCSYTSPTPFHRSKTKVRTVVISSYYFHSCAIEKYSSESFMLSCYHNYTHICLLLNLYRIYNMIYLQNSLLCEHLDTSIGC